MHRECDGKLCFGETKRGSLEGLYGKDHECSRRSSSL